MAVVMFDFLTFKRSRIMVSSLRKAVCSLLNIHTMSKSIDPGNKPANWLCMRSTKEDRGNDGYQVNGLRHVAALLYIHTEEEDRQVICWDSKRTNDEGQRLRDAMNGLSHQDYVNADLLSRRRLVLLGQEPVESLPSLHSNDENFEKGKGQLRTQCTT